MSAISWFRKPSANSKDKGRTFSSYCNFAYSALASFRMGSRGFLFRASCGGTVSKMFHHPQIAADRRGRNGHVFPVVRGNGPTGLEVLHLPEWAGISGQIHIQESG